MEQDKNDALKRFIGTITSRRAAQEEAPATPQAVGAALHSIFGGVGTITGNVVFVGESSPEVLAKLLARRRSHAKPDGAK